MCLLGNEVQDTSMIIKIIAILTTGTIVTAIPTLGDLELHASLTVLVAKATCNSMKVGCNKEWQQPGRPGTEIFRSRS